MTMHTRAAAGLRPLTGLLVDDSPVQRRFVRAALEDLPGCAVVAEARNGREAVSLTARLRPSVVLMDLELPVMGGLEAIAQIMAASPTPIVVTSSHLAASPAPGLQALANGAVELLSKPGFGSAAALQDYADALRTAVRVASRARVITHPQARLATRRPDLPSPTAPTRPLAVPPARSSDVASWGGGVPALFAPEVAQQASNEENRRSGHGDPSAGSRATQLVVVGASTGGPAALARLLGALPSDLAVPVLVVQHMAQGFIAGLAAWLDDLCALPVVVGRDGLLLAPRTVTLAPDAANATVTAMAGTLRLRVRPPEVGQWHVPSVDAAFSSAAQALGAAVVGVLLTGMGRDGAAGLFHLRATGALTLAQDEATSAVWGMPGAAAASGAVGRLLPLEEIAPAVLAAVQS